ncbi:MAG: hypothetical protein IJW67_07880 [Blautia sp.]|nr:hypothetical protein [Blautia sp.]
MYSTDINRLWKIKNPGSKERRHRCYGSTGTVSHTVTVHLPACLSEEQRSHVEKRLKESGLAETTVFDYYSFREE